MTGYLPFTLYTGNGLAYRRRGIMGWEKDSQAREDLIVNGK